MPPTAVFFCRQCQAGAPCADPGERWSARYFPRLPAPANGKTTLAIEYLTTSLGRDRVTLYQVEAFWRGHWTIENVTHYPRDESFGEDRSQVRAGNAPQALAALRNAVAAQLRIEGWTTLPAGFR